MAPSLFSSANGQRTHARRRVPNLLFGVGRLYSQRDGLCVAVPPENLPFHDVSTSRRLRRHDATPSEGATDRDDY
jgi:hypothetical protein